MKLFLLVVLLVQRASAFCCWYGSCTGECEAQGDIFCDGSEAQCEGTCGGYWCDDETGPTLAPNSAEPTPVPPPTVPLPSEAGCFVAKDHDITLLGEKIYLKGINWFGAETEKFAPHGLWNCKTVDFFLDILADAGFNALRYPTARDTVLANPVVEEQCNGVNTWMDGATALDAMDYIFQKAADRGILIMLDMHRYDYASWPDDGLYGGFGDAAEGEATMVQAWEILARRFKDQWNVVLADLANEPHGCTWAAGAEATDFDAFAARLGDKIHAIAPHWLIVVEGVGSSPGCPFQTSPYNHWWGGNIECADTHPVELALPNRLVYSPHNYGPGVFEQPYFAGLTTNFSAMADVWDSHYGSLPAKDPAFPPILPGEFGANSDKDPREIAWLAAYSDYLADKVDEGIPGNFFWCLNPNSGDTGGLLLDDWETIDSVKLPLLDAIIPRAPTSATSSPTTHPSPRPASTATLSTPSRPHRRP